MFSQYIYSANCDRGSFALEVDLLHPEHLKRFHIICCSIICLRHLRIDIPRLYLGAASLDLLASTR